MGKSPLRQAFGALKQKMFDEWPYYFMQTEGKKMAATTRQALALLPPLSCNGSGRFEAHMLCGEKHVDMGIWASWSLLRFLQPSQLWIHSDGTISPASKERWNSVVAGVHFVEPAEGDAAWQKSGLAACQNLDEHRRTCYVGRKLTDFHFFGNSDKIIVLDSDILCFKRPEEVICGFELSGKEIVYNSWQFGEAYIGGAKPIEQATGVRPPDGFNSGLMVISRFGKDDFLRLEHYMEQMRASGISDWSHCWAEQTMYGMAAAAGGPRPLPETYQICGGKKSSNTVARHYVGVPSIRPRFYTEGVRELLKECAAKN